MRLLSPDPAVLVFWGGVAVMAGASWLMARRPEVVVRLASPGRESVADQAERWLQGRN